MRELEEELGIAVAPSALSPIGFASEPLAERHLVLLLFRCPTWMGEPQGRDGQALQWSTPSELAALPMPEVDRRLLATLSLNST
jgi:8-oxo-dGTP diphosphatase